MPATKSKRNRRLADVVKVPEAMSRMKVTKEVIYKLIESGYFSKRRQSQLSANSHRLIFVDEIDRYLELVERFPEDTRQDRQRIKSGMMQHRAEQGRITK